MATAETETAQSHDDSTTPVRYAPPPGPPPSHVPQRQPLQAPALLPTSSEIPLEHLAAAGWYPLPISPGSSLYEAYSKLFTLSASFFALPNDHPSKTSRPANWSKSWHGEDGWSRVEGEKQLLSVRHSKHAPTEQGLREAVEDVWKVSAPILVDMMRNIARSLGLDEDAFDPMIVPCLVIPGEEQEGSPTLMRMFRYDRPSDMDGPPKIVSEAHRDLGLVTLVVGSSPGLEVFYPPNPPYAPQGAWIPLEQQQLEQQVEEEEARGTEYPKLTATIMTGQCLSHLVNNRYRPGPHRVLVHPPSSTDSDPFRYSIVFALRPISSVSLSNSGFSSPITEFTGVQRAYDLDGKTAGQVMQDIAGRLFNVNIDKDVRDRQKKKLMEGKILKRFGGRLESERLGCASNVSEEAGGRKEGEAGRG